MRENLQFLNGSISYELYSVRDGEVQKDRTIEQTELLTLKKAFGDAQFAIIINSYHIIMV
jgi:hypothetical protein